MKGINPVYFMHFIVAQSYLAYLSALTVAPRVDRVPSMSMLSLIEVGIPNSGGKYFSISH